MKFIRDVTKSNSTRIQLKVKIEKSEGKIRRDNKLFHNSFDIIYGIKIKNKGNGLISRFLRACNIKKTQLSISIFVTHIRPKTLVIDSTTYNSNLKLDNKSVLRGNNAK